MIRFDESVCRDLSQALRREWLETNGLGGYASSTINGLNTRRYHGLLVAATRPPLGRMVLLSKLEETLVVDGRRFELSANRYPGVFHPQGYLYLKEFRQDPFPVFVYGVEGLEIEKSVFMKQGENTTVVRYELRAPRAACTLELRPLIAFRDYHSTAHENDALDPRFEIDANRVKLAPYAGLPPLYLVHTGAGIQPAGYWYRNFEYDAERERGLDFHEDLFNPLVLVFDLSRDRRAIVTASTVVPGMQPGALPPPSPSPTSLLTRAAGQFIVRRGDHYSVIAGYHWFGDWGRDTMIALPGLTLATGRYDVARSILLEWATHVDQGMLPNRFPDAGEAPEYNTVDATLWFVEAVRAFLAATGDYGFVRANLSPVLEDIIAWHARGTRYGIHLDTDGLLQAGGPGTQLTWMDARIGGRAVTPRHGKPVEIQALWYNALCVIEDLTGNHHYRELADRARASFLPAFWNEAAGCLYDAVDGDTRDGSIRPNQIFAVSLFHKMPPLDKAKAVVDAVARHLLTPYGLRTLSPDDPNYRGRYEGDPASRDGAYHQGTVWPWLLGPFMAAYGYVHGSHPLHALDALRQYMEQEGVGQLPEVFDGDPPHRPGGCIAQAWSVAALCGIQL
ncbi:MAG TPA: amylo-alpha-1,6-glucosidase [Bryobacteraceae bacterium]|nr:amylo-alpha-1,6-glucosidase [Bryobacteraceae bacterium]